MTPQTNGRLVIILGTGGHARVLLAILRAEGALVLGCLAPAPPSPPWPDGVAYLGGDEALTNFDPTAHALVNGLGSTGAIGARRAVFDYAAARGFSFRGLRHASAIVDPLTSVAESAHIMAGSIVQSGARIEANVLINTGAIIDHDTCVGVHSHIATGARLSGGVTVGEGVHVGAGATLIQGVRVGPGAVIAAGAVVIRDVEPGSVQGGVPARPLKFPQVR